MTTGTHARERVAPLAAGRGRSELARLGRSLSSADNNLRPTRLARSLSILSTMPDAKAMKEKAEADKKAMK